MKKYYKYIEIIKEFAQNQDMQIIFQTGKKNYAEILEKLKLIYPACGWHNRIYDMLDVAYLEILIVIYFGIP